MCELIDGKLASGGEDRSIRIWSENNNLFKCCDILNAHKSRVSAITQLSDGKLITAGGADIIVFKLIGDNYVRIQTKIAHQSNITGLLKLRNGCVASYSRDKRIRIWEINRNDELVKKEVLKEHSHSVYDMIELNDGRLASVGGDNVVIIWKSGTMIE